MHSIFRLTRRQMLAGTAAGAFAALGGRFALAADGKVLKIRSYADIQNLDPSFISAAPDTDIGRAIFSSLIVASPGSEWGYDLDAAESLKQIDDKHIEFKLKPGLVWSGGFGEVTADDVKYSFERIADPAAKSPYAGDWETLDHVEVKDKLSGVIVLKEAFAPLMTSTLPQSSGTIVCKAAVEKAGGKFTTTPPATSGPYVIKEWTPKQKTVLARNPDWKGEAPAFDEIQVFPIEDAKAAELAFEAGDLDFTWVAGSSIKRLEGAPPKGGKIERHPSLAYIWMGMNVESKPFDNPKVRRAVQHAVDVGTVVEAAYFGAAEPSTGIIAPGLIGHREKRLYGYDKDKAKALLAEAGLADGFECTIDVLNTEEYLAAVQVVQSQLAEVGIKLTIQSHDSGTFWTLGDEKSGDSWKKIQMTYGRFSMAPDPSYATEWFTPEQVGVWNWERWRSPEFGDLNKKAKVELDPKKRNEMYIKLQDLMEEGGAYVFITHGVNGVLYRTTVKSATSPDGTPIMRKFAPA